MVNIEEIYEMLEERKVIKPNGCWELCIKTSSRGYSRIEGEKKEYLAHRISAAHHLGLNLNDRVKQALHKNECYNRACWNPEHLYVGNASLNMRNAVDIGKKNQKKTHCKRGHEFTPDNLYLDWKGNRYCKECDKLRGIKRTRKRRKIKTQRLKASSGKMCLEMAFFLYFYLCSFEH